MNNTTKTAEIGTFHITTRRDRDKNIPVPRPNPRRIARPCSGLPEVAPHLADDRKSVAGSPRGPLLLQGELL